MWKKWRRARHLPRGARCMKRCSVASSLPGGKPTRLRPGWSPACSAARRRWPASSSPASLTTGRGSPLLPTLVAEARSESGQAERAIAALAAAWRLRSVCRDGLWSVGAAGRVHLAEPSGEVPGELLPPRPVPVGELEAWLAEIRAATAMLTTLASSRPGSVRPQGGPGRGRRAAAGRSARPAEAGRVTGRRGRRKAGRGDAPAS
jgi:hypothetical protein